MKKTNNNIAIQVHDLTASYEGKPVIRGIDLKLPQGELIAIIGPNGGGKTTLLKSIIQSKSIESGSIYFFDKSLDEMRSKVAYMPQRQNVDWQFPILVREVVMMGRYPHMGLFKRASSIDKEKVHNALQAVDMEDLADRQIGALSRGQQQRVFIARAIAQEADIYLMDEPFAGVDAASTKLILDIMKKITQEGKTIVMVHHTLESVEAYCSYAVLLNTYVHAAGPVQEVLRPKLLRSAYGKELDVLRNMKDLLGYMHLSILKDEGEEKNSDNSI